MKHTLGLMYYLNLPEAKQAVKRSREWFKTALLVCGQGETYPHPRQCFEEGYAQGVFDTKKAVAIQQAKRKKKSAREKEAREAGN